MTSQSIKQIVLLQHIALLFRMSSFVFWGEGYAYLRINFALF